ncbi:MAG: hypothetical protein AAGI52_05720 [Bacteroidota bacterium]
MRSALLSLALLAGPALQAQDLTGTWAGPLIFPGGRIELILTIDAEEDGYTATVDSPTQGVYGVPVGIDARGDSVFVDLDEFSARFDAALVGDVLVGTFVQERFELDASLARLEDPEFLDPTPLDPEPSNPEPLDPESLEAEPLDPGLNALVGSWSGEIAGALPVVLHLRAGDETGRLGATLDSPSQNAFGIPTDGATLTDGTLSVHLPSINGSFEGDVDGETIRGTWSQNDRNLPLVLTRQALRDGE